MINREIIMYLQQHKTGGIHELSRVLREEETIVSHAINTLCDQQLVELDTPIRRVDEGEQPYRLRPGYKNRPAYKTLE